MKRLFWLIAFIIFLKSARAQFGVQYNPAVQPTDRMQYFKPVGNLFVGDCIPFFHNGSYYLYWLLDSAHHSALKGLGGHQWALSISSDLVNWKHQPIVLGIDEDWEKSICTGSVVYYNKRFYAFYATRLINATGNVNEQLSYAISDDGIHFKKQKPNPFLTSVPGYNKRNFRDPKVTVDSSGAFHLFVSSLTDSSLGSETGALVHLVSKDLKKWDVVNPLLINQQDVPECPDYFHWNNWYYIIYGRGGNTFYLKSNKPYGPWDYPSSQAFNEDWSNVVKTAEFTNGRRIAAGWVPGRRNNKDDGGEIFGGNTVFREVIQNEDGSLSTEFPAEMIPATGKPVALNLISDSLVSQIRNNGFRINSSNGRGAAYYPDIPLNCRISLEIEPLGDVENYGLYLRSQGEENSGYKLMFSPNNREVRLNETGISAVAGLDKKITVDIIMKEDIIDVCIDNKRCIVNRLYEKKGTNLWLFAKHGTVVFNSIKIAPLKENK